MENSNKRPLLEVTVTDSWTIKLVGTDTRVSGKPLGFPKLLCMVLKAEDTTGHPVTDFHEELAGVAPERANAYALGGDSDTKEAGRHCAGYLDSVVQFYELRAKSLREAFSL